MTSWNQIIHDEMDKDYFKHLIKFVQKDAKQYKIFPPNADVFNAFKYCPMSNVKVVILGADPYTNEGQAHGLSFSVNKGITIPPSLNNIFKELKDDLRIQPPSHGCLVDWAKQGVLLLNTILTVREGQPSSHANQGWEIFTSKIISSITQIDRPIVFLLWGSLAKAHRAACWKNGFQHLTLDSVHPEGAIVDHATSRRHLTLDSVHPSPLSAYRGFFGCKHFSKANKFLVENNLEPIDWRLV
jgi:uracil-DNA glycosylase